MVSAMNRQQRRAAQRQGKPLGSGSTAADVAFARAGQMHQAGRLAEAETLCREALGVDPHHAPSLHLLGVLALQTGQPALAADLIGRAISADTRSAPYHNNLGMALRALDRAHDAEVSFRNALALKPDYRRALINLGQLLAASRPVEAMSLLRRALSTGDFDLDAGWSLAVLLHQQGQLQEAGDLYRQAVQVAPDTVELHENLGALLLVQGRGLEASDSFRRALELKPASAETWLSLAGALERETRLSEALAANQQAAVLQPDRAATFNAIGNLLANLGRLDESIEAYRRAIALDPNYASARSNLLMTLHSAPGVSGLDILSEARRYGARLTAKSAASFANTRDPNRRLKIGYVSADFRVHPVGAFLDRVIPAHDKEKVEVLFYSDTQFADEQTERLRAHADGWRPINGRTDAEAASLIAADGIDVLVDLAGHTGCNRLTMFGARAAPVQVSWLGYFGTTGVPAIDHVIADAVVAPPADAALFTEQIMRLSRPYLCWSPPHLEMPVVAFPGLQERSVTFGCFNNRAKITSETIAVWAQILNQVDGSRLFLKSWSLADEGCRSDLVDAFANHGVEPGRLILEGFSPRAEGLAAYNRVDIALDPFPFGGCTTTADTLWMGVPVVTLSGERWSGRMSQMILSSVGLDDWIAGDIDSYVAIAVSRANNLQGLAQLRASLRDRLERSSFCDSEGFTRTLEDAYRTAWRSWCEGAG
jgi:protein O-GlcNAc transferase